MSKFFILTLGCTLSLVGCTGTRSERVTYPVTTSHQSPCFGHSCVDGNNACSPDAPRPHVDAHPTPEPVTPHVERAPDYFPQTEPAPPAPKVKDKDVYVPPVPSAKRYPTDRRAAELKPMDHAPTLMRPTSWKYLLK